MRVWFGSSGVEGVRRILMPGLAGTAALLVSVTLAAAQSTTAPPAIPGAPAGVTAFVNVGVVPMDSERVLQDYTVLVKQGWITALGPSAKVKVPADAVRIDGRGKYLLPGLSDCHAHLLMGRYWRNVDTKPGDDAAHAEAVLLDLLTQGVTTIRNLDWMTIGRIGADGSSSGEGGAEPGTLSASDSTDGRLALALRARVAAGTLLGPRIYTSGQWGPSRYVFGSRHAQAAAAPDSVAFYLAAYKAAGYDFIKVHDAELPVIFDSLVAAAHRLGLPVVGHAPSGATLEHALATMHSIEHLTGYFTDDEAKQPRIPNADTAGYVGALAAATARAGVWNCPTVLASHDWFASQTRLFDLVLKGLQEAGAGLLLGTDDGGRGYKITAELQAMVGAGLTPYQALVTGTRNMAAYLGELDQSGTIAVNKRADLVLLAGNPLEDVQSTKQPVGVMLGGQWLLREELERRLAALQAAQSSP